MLIRALAVLLPLAILGCRTVNAGTASPGEPPADIAELSRALRPLQWWLGTWEADDGKSSEHWVAASGAVFGVSLADGGSFEVMIVDDGPNQPGRPDGILRLHAMPGGQPGTEFTQREVGPQFAVFANEGHDFPKVVGYWRSQEARAAEISGGGRSVPFRFHRAPARPAPELEAADRAFAADTAARRIAGWVAAFAPDGWMLTRGKKLPRSEIGAVMGPFLEKVHIDWAPVASGRRGDVGFTVGKALYTDSSDGSTSKGTYVTIWRRQPDGGWKVLFDTGRVVHDE